MRSVAVMLMTLFLATSQLAAQRILEWPLRTSAQPEALMRGGEAAFWNPAAVRATGSGRGEAIVVDQRTPDIIGINGFAAAGSWKLDARTTFAAGYQHVAIDDIGETSTSPVADGGEPTFSVGEDQFAVSASHILSPSVSAGAGVRYDRSNETGINESTTSLVAGFLVTPVMALRPAVGISVATQEGDVTYVGGVEIGTSLSSDIDVRAGYGLRGGNQAIAVEHRLGVTGNWRQMVSLTAGVATSAVGSERNWQPVLGASLHLSRYELGVLRETLANDFGAAYSFRFRLAWP